MYIDQSPTAEQLAIITEQIGRIPQGIQAIACYDQDKNPAVLRMQVWVDEHPFPTLYWLCSTPLQIALSRLEAQGLIKTLEQKLREDTLFLQQHWQSHLDYIKQRWHYMPPEMAEQIYRNGYADLLSRRGIGGISNWHQVRCLHTHYAHHLCGNNAIGRWLDAHYPHLQTLL